MVITDAPGITMLTVICSTRVSMVLKLASTIVARMPVLSPKSSYDSTPSVIKAVGVSEYSRAYLQWFTSARVYWAKLKLVSPSMSKVKSVWIRVKSPARCNTYSIGEAGTPKVIVSHGFTYSTSRYT